MATGKGPQRARKKVPLPPLVEGEGATVHRREQRAVRFLMRLTPTERRRLQELADHFHTTATNVLSSLIESAWDSAQDDPDWKGERRPSMSCYVIDAHGKVGDLASGGRLWALQNWLKSRPEEALKRLGPGWPRPQEAADAIAAAAGQATGAGQESARVLARLLRKCQGFAVIIDRGHDEGMQRLAFLQAMRMTEGGNEAVTP